MATMKIFLKEVGKDPVSMTVAPSDTVESIKLQLQLSNVKIRLKQQNLTRGRTLESYGVKSGDILTAFSNNIVPAQAGTATWSEYQARKRLDSGKTVKTYKHKQLHEKTQEVVMQESAHLAQKIDKANKENKERFENLEKQVGINMKKISGSQEQWIWTLNSSSVSVANLNTLLTTHGLPKKGTKGQKAVILSRLHPTCLLYTSDAADE